jgi:hypothetical protein
VWRRLAELTVAVELYPIRGWRRKPAQPGTRYVARFEIRDDPG